MYARVGINILMMDYRGYGKSTGVPTEKGLKYDADAVLKFTLSHSRYIQNYFHQVYINNSILTLTSIYLFYSLKNSPQVVFGRSLGGAVAIYLANKYPDNVKGVILENTFLSVAAMVDVLMPYVSWMKSLVLRIGWNNLNDIKNLLQPIMFISGTILMSHDHISNNLNILLLFLLISYHICNNIYIKVIRMNWCHLHI